jgi:D-tyrosyl-tRNA(Tyr) deacylase
MPARPLWRPPGRPTIRLQRCAWAGPAGLGGVGQRRRVVVGKIGRGLCTLVGVSCDDDEKAADRLAAKLWQLRLFPDGTGNMNRSAEDLGLPVLVVSQFTLYADTTRGRRPSFTQAATPEVARALVDRVVAQLRAAGAEVATRHFGATMDVSLVNQGPVTILVET